MFYIHLLSVGYVTQNKPPAQLSWNRIQTHIFGILSSAKFDLPKQTKLKEQTLQSSNKLLGTSW